MLYLNRDGSDESTDNCIATVCPRYAFRCMYGACVSGNAECNRKMECLDGSDEATDKCPTKTEEQLHGSCDRTSFQCDNGDCIGVDALCDGNQNNTYLFEHIFSVFYNYSINTIRLLIYR